MEGTTKMGDVFRGENFEVSVAEIVCVRFGDGRITIYTTPSALCAGETCGGDHAVAEFSARCTDAEFGKLFARMKPYVPFMITGGLVIPRRELVCFARVSPRVVRVVRRHTGWTEIETDEGEADSAMRNFADFSALPCTSAEIDVADALACVGMALGDFSPASVMIAATRENGMVWGQLFSAPPKNFLVRATRKEFETLARGMEALTFTIGDESASLPVAVSPRGVEDVYVIPGGTRVRVYLQAGRFVDSSCFSEAGAVSQKREIEEAVRAWKERHP